MIPRGAALYTRYLSVKSRLEGYLYLVASGTIPIMADCHDDDRSPVVEDLIRRSAEDAHDCGISIGARDSGAVLELVLASVIEATRKLMAVRDDPDQLRRPHPYGDRFTKRASELHRVPQLVPFVYSRLVRHRLLPAPSVFIIRSLVAELPPRRQGIAGRRPGLVAIATSDVVPNGEGWAETGAGWTAIDHDHVIEHDRDWAAGPSHGMTEQPLTRLVEATVAAHPETPIVVDLLNWPTRANGIVDFGLRYPDIASQLWRHPDGQLIFRFARPLRRASSTSSRSLDQPLRQS